MRYPYRRAWNASHIAHRCFSIAKPSIIIVGGGPSGLLLSYFLQKLYSIPTRCIERQIQPTHHPQAHFLNLRTMEILYAHFPSLHKAILQKASPIHLWKNYVYCRTLSKSDVFAEINQIPSDTIAASPHWHSALSPTQFVHFPQNQFEDLLSQYCEEEGVQLERGVELIDLKLNSDRAFPQVTLRHHAGHQNSLETCKAQFVIGADGAHSIIRKLCQIGMSGDRNLQSIANVYFTCVPLAQQAQRDNPGMLYFIFNTKVIGVLVAHDFRKGEFVFQIPFFPPQESIASDFTKAQCIEKIKAILPNANMTQTIKIHSIGQWQMSARIANAFCDTTQRAFLLGDAAHQFPPAGGFGMNAGIQDAHNLAWKLAYHIHSDDPTVLASYDRERRSISQSLLQLSLRNVERTMKIPEALHLTHSHAQKLSNVINSGPMQTFLPGHFLRAIQKQAMKVGMSPLSLLENSCSFIGQQMQRRAQSIVQSRQSLGMLFYHFDIGYSYRSSIWSSRVKRYLSENALDQSAEYINSETSVSEGKDLTFCPIFEVGMRFPHLFVYKTQDIRESDAISTLTLQMKGLRKSLLPFLLIMNGDVNAHVSCCLEELEERIGEELYYVSKTDEKWKEFTRYKAMMIRPDGHVGYIWPTSANALSLQDVQAALSACVRPAWT